MTLFQILYVESIPQAYIPKRHTLIQVFPPANANNKSANAYIYILFRAAILEMAALILLKGVPTKVV